MQIIIINGPNLNLLGKREPSIYGNVSFGSYYDQLIKKYPTATFSYFQSNHEGELIDKLQEVGFSQDGIILNAAGYTHTSIALADTVAAIDTPVIEVHISNIHDREKFRRHSYVAANAKVCITGFGLEGYELALKTFITLQSNQH